MHQNPLVIWFSFLGCHLAKSKTKWVFLIQILFFDIQQVVDFRALFNVCFLIFGLHLFLYIKIIILKLVEEEYVEQIVWFPVQFSRNHQTSINIFFQILHQISKLLIGIFFLVFYIKNKLSHNLFFSSILLDQKSFWFFLIFQQFFSPVFHTLKI